MQIRHQEAIWDFTLKSKSWHWFHHH